MSTHIPFSKRAPAGKPPGLSERELKRHMRSLARLALTEDVGSGDVTSAIFPSREKGRAIFLAKSAGVMSGIFMAEAVFMELYGKVRFMPIIHDGETFSNGDVLAEVEAPLHVLFTGERVALNYLQQLSGVATMTWKYVQALQPIANATAKLQRHSPGKSIKIYDTRKTTPLLRVLEKKAVCDGGGFNHRTGLYDMAMLKNNHIDAAGGVIAAIQRLRDQGFFNRRPRLPLCTEARTITEAEQATIGGSDIVMLDNMTPAAIRAAAGRIRRLAEELGTPVPEIEVSGGITLQNISRYRGLPIDRISVGALTHSAPAADIAMRYR